MLLKRLGNMRIAWLAPVALAFAPPAAAAPAVAKAVPAAKAQTSAEPKPALWLLSDEDTKIYLFGTIHMLPPGFKWRSAAFDKVAAEASELVVETYDAPGEIDEAEIAAMFIAAEPRPILDRVPKNKRKALKRAIKETKLPREAFDYMHSWAAAMMIGLGQIYGSYGVDDPAEAPGVEDSLEAEFKAAGKPILSIEDGKAVLEGLNALPEAVQVQLLLDGLGEVELAPGENPVDDDAWARGEAEAMDVLEELPPEMYDVLVKRRNAAWTLWLEERLKRPGTLLVAVGAGHLAGPDSVQAMLGAKGLVARRVN